MKVTCLFIIGFIPAILCSCSLERAKPLFSRSVFDFSVELLQRIAEDNESHFVASTLSPWALLATISLGASGQTLKELRDVLMLNSYPCFNKNYLKLVNSINSYSSSDVSLERSSMIFTDENLPIRRSFKSTLRSNGLSDFLAVPFVSPDLASATINNYVSTATHDVITEIVSPGDLEDIMMLIVDAIFFKGAWNTPFLKGRTKQSKFYNHLGVATGVVDLMFLNSNFYCKDVDAIQSQVLELPYGNDERFAALLMLPYQNVTLFSVIEKLKLITLTTIYKTYEGKDKEPVIVQIPRFKMSTNLNNLRELLSDMGLKTMFETRRANFENISRYELFVSDFFQKADIEMNEEGTTAAAVSGAGFVSRSFPEYFIANKPFLFMIIDKQFMVPLFAGAYSKPSVY